MTIPEWTTIPDSDFNDYDDYNDYNKFNDYNDYNALCSKSNGRCDIKAEKREELESKSSHKSDILPPAAYKKWGDIFENIFFRL